MLDRTDVASPTERDRALSEVAPVLAAMGETASRDDLVRQVAERLDLEPAMVMGRVVAATPASGGERERGAAPAARRRGARAAAAPRPAELTSRERRERALLAMCIALPDEGAEYLARLDRRPPLADRRCAPPPGCASTPTTRPPTCPATTTSWPA